MEITTDGIVLLDRWVQVLEGTGNVDIRRLSDLRSYPALVLLGEPGSGKSSVLRTEAALAGTPVIKVRELLNDLPTRSADTLFLDALDEYRIEGEAADRVTRLAGAIHTTGASSWRVTCRSEDWRKGADRASLARATPGSEIVVARLLPLDHDEIQQLLLAFGEPDPATFIAKAHSLGSASAGKPASIAIATPGCQTGGPMAREPLCTVRGSGAESRSRTQRRLQVQCPFRPRQDHRRCGARFVGDARHRGTGDLAIKR